ncbi:MAG: manganese efflux pump, partial [Methanoregula sp.]|nr:manganese efflux pump [Methanoregula sp.]
MDLLTPVLIGIGLSMDCFAVSLAVGSTTTSRLFSWRSHPGPLLRRVPDRNGGSGVAAGISVIGYISAYNHCIAFIPL